MKVKELKKTIKLAGTSTKTKIQLQFTQKEVIVYCLNFFRKPVVKQVYQLDNNINNSYLIELKNFNNVVNLLDNNSEVEFVESDDKLYITNATNKLHLEATNVDLLEERNSSIDTIESELKITFTQFKELLKNVHADCFSKDIRPILQNVHITTSANAIQAVATNTHKLTVNEIEATFTEHKEFLVNGKIIKEVLSLKNIDNITMQQFKYGSCKLLFNQTEVTTYNDGNRMFPGITRVIPIHEQSVKINKKEWLNILKSFKSEFEKINKLILIDLKKDGSALTNYANGVSAPINTEVDKEMQIAVNGKYMIDLLSNIDNDTLTLEYGSPVRPIVIKEENSNIVKVLTPIRMR